jgi:hypothetical protein
MNLIPLLPRPWLFPLVPSGIIHSRWSWQEPKLSIV